ncbi:MAG: hypothetical protein QOI70_1482, partial [Microbacteriaceae bacterium]|nr:hypothetical protein [Microbacteriaceae bacterium]
MSITNGELVPGATEAARGGAEHVTEP